jgi:hypothetical protein
MSKQNRLSGYFAFWRRPAVQQRWRRVRWWTARALEKLGEGG